MHLAFSTYVSKERACNYGGNRSIARLLGYISGGHLITRLPSADDTVSIVASDVIVASARVESTLKRADENTRRLAMYIQWNSIYANTLTFRFKYIYIYIYIYIYTHASFINRNWKIENLRWMWYSETKCHEWNIKNTLNERTIKIK